MSAEYSDAMRQGVRRDIQLKLRLLLFHALLVVAAVVTFVIKPPHHGVEA